MYTLTYTLTYTLAYTFWPLFRQTRWVPDRSRATFFPQNFPPKVDFLPTLNSDSPQNLLHSEFILASVRDFLPKIERKA